MTTKNKSLSESVRDILSENANADTLKPGSKYKEPMPKSPAKVIEIGTGPVKPGDKNPDYTKGAPGKDTSKSSVSAVKAEPKKKLGEGEEEVLDNEDEIITEEDLEALIQEMQEDGLSEEEIQKNIDSILEDYEEVEVDEDGNVVLSEEDKVETNDDQVDLDAPIEMPEMDLDVDLTSDLEALYNGEELSEEFKAKAKTIFEAVVTSRLVEYQKKLDEAFESNLTQAISIVEENISADVEKYLDYVVESWVEENELALEAGLRTEITEDFIAGFRNLCIEHNINLPEDKVDVLEEQAEYIAQLEERLNEEIQHNVELKEAIEEGVKFEIIVAETDGLTDTQVEKIKELTESVKLTTEEEFAKTVKTLRENYFPNGAIKAPLDVDNDASNKDLLREDVEVPANMQKYVSAISRTNPK